MSPADSTDTAPGVVDATPVVVDPASYAAVRDPVEKDHGAAEGDPVDEADGLHSIEDLEGPVEVEVDSAGEEEGDEEISAEMLEFDFGGNKFEVPKDSVPSELATQIDQFVKGTWSDYTRKSQANAEQAKSLSQQGDALQKMAGLNGEALQTYSQGLQLRTELDQLSQVDLSALWTSDADNARRISDMIAAKEHQFQSVVAKVGKQEHELDAAHQAELVRRAKEGKAVLDKRIKGFSAEHAPSVVKYVVESYGMAQGEAEQWAMNPTVTEMAFKSMMYDRMQARAKKPSKSIPAQAVAVPAMKPKGASAGGSRVPDKMSMTQLGKHLGLDPQ